MLRTTLKSCTQQRLLCTSSLTSTSSISSITRISSIAAPSLTSSSLTSLLHPFCVRHGSTSSSQSARVNRAHSRASGSTYRAPKGRENDNPYHVKEPLPDIRTFRDAKASAEIRRKRRVEHRRSRATEPDMLDFEIQGNEIVSLKDQYGRRRDGKKLKRVKTAVHKAHHLKKARERIESGIEWNEEEQNAAEADADRFLQAQYDIIAEERSRLMEESRDLPEEERRVLLEQFERDAEQAIEQVEQEAAAAEEGEAATEKKQKVPSFGVQTILKFLAEFDIVIKPISSAASKKKQSSLSSSLTSSEENPLDQNILVYDVISRFNFADYIIVVKAQSARQMRHLAESVYKLARELNACSANPRTLSLEGRDREDWMLVDTGRVWLYFFNRIPVPVLPTAQGIFGISFQVPAVKVAVQARQEEYADGEQDDQQQQIGSGQARLANNNQINNVTFQSYSNPFDPTADSASSSSAAFEDDHDDSFSTSSSPRYASSSPSQPLDPSTLVHSTSSQINSTMWYEPTPDSPYAQKKSERNMTAQKEQMKKAEGMLDERFIQYDSQDVLKRGKSTVDAKQKKTIDADFTASSTPITPASSAASSSLDPSLLLLHSSNFIHPVLENLEKNYGDLRVPTNKVAKLKDYQHEDIRNDVVLLTEAQEKEKRSKSTTATQKKRVKRVESIEIQDMTSASTVVAQ